MGNKKNIDKFLPAHHLRIKAFARALAGIHPGREPKASDVQKVLSKLNHPVDISDQALSGWLKGITQPSAASVNWIKQGLPGCADWLEPNIDSSPLSRFLCALDVWGSPIDCPTRKLDAASKGITVGTGLNALAKRWAPKRRNSGRYISFEAVIPRLNCPVPPQVLDNVYLPVNPLSLMDFMFRCGPYLELSDEQFAEWAIDMAALTLMIGAFFEGTSLTERLQSGTTGSYNSLAYRIFFRGHGDWPNLESVGEELQDFREFDDEVIDYPQRLMQAREVLREKLFSIGCDLSIAEELSGLIKDRGRMWQEPLDTHGETFAQSDLIHVKRNILPAAPGQYRYELRHLSSGKRIALCHDLENGTQAPLPERPDLYNRDTDSFSWGYSGSGPTLLVVSILAHHLGHDDFDTEEIDRLLDMYISRFPQQLIETSFFLTTELIDRCLSD